MEPKKRVYFRVKALIVESGKFLVLRRSDEMNDGWDLPGGGMEYGETAEDTVVREVKEETGLEVTPIRVLDTWNNVREEYQFTGIIYLCHLDAGEICLSEEHNKYEWIELGSNRVKEMHNVFKEKMCRWNWDLITI